MTKTYKRLFLFTLLLITVVLLYFYKTRPRPVEVQVAEVVAGNIEETIANTRAGTVKACRRARLAPAIGGQIDSLPVKEGQPVKQGDVLLALWSDDLQAQLKLANSEADAAKDHAESICVQARNARRAADRKQVLRKTRVVSEEDLERSLAQAESQAADCQAARTSARVSVESVGVVMAQLEKTRLTAPFDGVIVEVNGELGEYVTPSPPGIPTLPAIDMIDRSCFYVVAPIDEVDAARIAANMSARISLDAYRGKVFPATVKRIADYVTDREKQARTVDIEVHFTQPDDMQKMLPGYSADAEVIVKTKQQTLYVPTQAIFEQDQVFVLDTMLNTLALRQVKTGIANWQFTEIVAGLYEHEKVVTTPDRTGVEDGAYARIEAP